MSKEERGPNRTFMAKWVIDQGVPITATPEWAIGGTAASLSGKKESVQQSSVEIRARWELQLLEKEITRIAQRRDAIKKFLEVHEEFTKAGIK